MDEEAIEPSLDQLVYVLEDLKAKKINEAQLSDTVADLQAENLKLKETNICLEKQVAEQQNRIDRLTLRCQSSSSSEQEFCFTREQLLENSSKLLEEENTKLSHTIADLQVQLLHANEKSCLDQEEWHFHRQKMEKLVEFVGQLLDKAAILESQVCEMQNACDRVAPTAAAFAGRCCSLQLSYSHSQCRIKQLTEELHESQRQLVAKETQAAAAEAKFQSAIDETQRLQSLLKSRIEEVSSVTERSCGLRKRIANLEAELLQSQQIIRQQSELLQNNILNQQAAPNSTKQQQENEEECN